MEGQPCRKAGLTAAPFPLPPWQGHMNYLCTVVLVWESPPTTLLDLHGKHGIEHREGEQHHFAWRTESRFSHL